MVRVNIWWPDFSGNIGHGSMFIGGTYVSNWPGSLSSVFAYGAGAVRTYEMDTSSEGGPPDKVINIHGLDEQAMRDWWDSFKTDIGYSFAYQNCMTTVALGLCKGSPNPMNNTVTARKISTHISLNAFAEGLTASTWYTLVFGGVVPF